jgi:hypothetical protein
VHSLEKGNLSLFPEKVSHSCSQKVPTHLGKRCLILFPVVRCYPRVSSGKVSYLCSRKGCYPRNFLWKGVLSLVLGKRCYPRTQKRPSPGVHSKAVSARTPRCYCLCRALGGLFYRATLLKGWFRSCTGKGVLSQLERAFCRILGKVQFVVQTLRRFIVHSEKVYSPSQKVSNRIVKSSRCRTLLRIVTMNYLCKIN